jgi:hypothetical protein
MVKQGHSEEVTSELRSKKQEGESIVESGQREPQVQRSCGSERGTGRGTQKPTQEE